jgi:hypothetical protein
MLHKVGLLSKDNREQVSRRHLAIVVLLIPRSIHLRFPSRLQCTSSPICNTPMISATLFLVSSKLNLSEYGTRYGTPVLPVAIWMYIDQPRSPPLVSSFLNTSLSPLQTMQSNIFGMPSLLMSAEQSSNPISGTALLRINSKPREIQSWAVVMLARVHRTSSSGSWTSAGPIRRQFRALQTIRGRKRPWMKSGSAGAIPTLGEG